jgi:mono/diheme cytochrome c family protein
LPPLRTIRKEIVSASAGVAAGFAAPPERSCARNDSCMYAIRLVREAGLAAPFFRMILGRMSPRTKSILFAVIALALAIPFAACGEQKIQVASSNPAHSGAVLFQQRCAGCHTLSAAGTHGSAANIKTRERTDGPNFNVRAECVERVLYAIANGGFSGAIMPQNIAVGADAQKIAAFVAKYAGAKAASRPAGDGDAANGFHCTSTAG